MSSQPQYPRDRVYRVLSQVLNDRRPLDDAMAEVLEEVAPEHRAWLQENCSGVLRWKGRLDQIIDSIALTKKPSGAIRRYLLLATYQLCAQDRTNPGRVVSETVAGVKKKEGEAPSRFVNALLRKVADHAAEYRSMEAPAKLEGATGASWASIPVWLWDRLLNDHGAEWAKEFAKASLERPSVWVRARSENWSENPGEVPGSFQAEVRGPIQNWPGFSEGLFFVQDISSQKLVHEITEAAKKRGVKTALDLCAAPGGKSVGMAWSGLQVTSTDRDETRLKLLRDTISRAAPGVQIVERDKVSGLPAFDLVWVDSPCSGTGIIRRHPDVRWLRRDTELDGLFRTQQEVIRDGWAKVRPGGLFAYSVCSVLKEEGEGAWKKAELKGARELQRWSLAPHLSPGGDGFWAMLAEKQA